MEKHSEDLRNVREGDTVTIQTTEDESFQVTCTHTQTNHADPRSGEVRETNLWLFDSFDHSLAASITDGLKSSSDDAEFPQHSQVWDKDAEESIGYIESLTIHGEMEA